MQTSFQAELVQWGPESLTASPKLSLSEARAYTRKTALGHYENFPVVSWLLPSHLRQPFYDIYAFCRWSDDLGDEVPSADESLRLLAWWRDELQAGIEFRARHPVCIAVGQTIADYQLDHAPFFDLITAFEQDQRQTRYQTFAELLEYCRYSANPVGRILLQLTGNLNERTAPLSDSVCTGLQLINFWQDVARDWEIGRVYLPQADLAEFGVSETDLAERNCTEAFRKLLQQEVERAESRLQAGRTLARMIDRNVRFDIRLFALGGLKICEKIRRHNYDVLTQRPQLNKSDLPSLLWQASWSWR